MAPDILYEICPGQWLVETELSHSNRELCIGWTLLVGRRGNPYSNALIKQSKGRVNGEKHFFSCLISWLRRYCALSSAQRGAGLRSPHQLRLTHPFFLSCPELMIYWCVSFPPPSMGRHTSRERLRALSSSWIVTLSHPEVRGPDAHPRSFPSRFRRGLTILVDRLGRISGILSVVSAAPSTCFTYYVTCGSNQPLFSLMALREWQQCPFIPVWVVTPVALSILYSNAGLADSVIWLIN